MIYLMLLSAITKQQNNFNGWIKATFGVIPVLWYFAATRYKCLVKYSRVLKYQEYIFQGPAMKMKINDITES